MIFIWLLTGWFKEAYNTVIWPFLGFIFMPFTTLAYMAAMFNNGGSVNGWWTVLVVVAAVLDISSWGGTSQHS